MTHFPGWRNMTGVQRRNAKMEALFASAREQGHTGFNSQTISARDVKIGDVLEGYGEVDQVEADDTNVLIGWKVIPAIPQDPELGDWRDFAPDEKLVRFNSEAKA